MNELNDAKSDAALMEEVANGDSRALGRLYCRHSNAVRSMIVYVAPGMSSHDVDDTTQEVFLSLGKAARSYRHQSLFNGFLFRIAANRARDWQRRSWLRFNLGENRQWRDATVSSGTNEIGPSHKAILHQTVRQMVESLSYPHREVLVLHTISGFTCDEIATMLNIRPKTVRTRLHRARNAILQHKKASIWKEAISEKSL